MNSTSRKQITEIKELCLKDYVQNERWPTYYERRYLEFITFLDFLPDKRYLKILELGCGIGYYSAFLSRIATEVTATDLEQVDTITHSPGLQVTRDFLSSLGIKNIIVMHASAEELPFENNSFDLVFSSHVLEHVPDVNKAVMEINRVLKPGGINFCIVPTSTDKIYAFFLFYIYLIKRIFVKLNKQLFSKKKPAIENNTSSSDVADKVNYYSKYLPFPPPHGAYPDYLTELKSWRLSRWKSVLTNHNKIKLLSQHGLQLNPLLPVFGSIFPAVGVKIYSLTRKFENRFSKNPLLKYLGISTLIITEKEK